jgi:hypothetical protein
MVERVKLQRSDIVDMICGIRHSKEDSDDLVNEATQDFVREIKKIMDALRPFYACVHKDNGEVSVSTGNLKVDHWITLDSLCAELERIE